MTRKHSWLTWAQLGMLWSSWLRSPILVKGGHWAGCWAGYTTPCLSFTWRILFTHPIHSIETLYQEGGPPLWGWIDDFNDFLNFYWESFCKVNTNTSTQATYTYFCVNAWSQVPKRRMPKGNLIWLLLEKIFAIQVVGPRLGLLNLFSPTWGK